MAHTLTLWTNNLDHAGWADRAGVDRIGVDLESHGKATRQAGLDTWLSRHTLADVERVGAIVERAQLFVRTDPVHDGSAEQVEALLDAGVRVLMLPNFTTFDEVARLSALVAGRAQLVPLVERAAAVDVIASLPRLGISEIHVGLNDLSIDLGQQNRLAVLALPVMDRISQAARTAGLRLGLGGLGRALDAHLPVPSELVYAQHARLGAAGALLARSFFFPAMDEAGFAREIARLRERLEYWETQPEAVLDQARASLLALAATDDRAEVI